MSENAETLIRKAQAGDMEAFALLFEELRPDVFRVACRLVGPDGADDVVMESFLKAWQAIPRFRRRSSLKTWVYRIARNCALDFVRSRSRRREEPLPEPGRGGRRLALADLSQTLPDVRLTQEETVCRVTDALARLSEEHRTTLLLRYADDLSYAEIAAATGVSIGTVMSRIFNGKRKLRKVLEEEGEA